MTAQERIDAAMAALEIAKTNISECAFEDIDNIIEAGKVVGDATFDLADEVVRLRKEVVEYQMALAGAEALVLSHEGTIEKRDREIEQLQKWQDDAFCHVEISRNYLSTELKTMKDDSSGVIDQLKQFKDEADRLITEAQEAKE